MVSYQFLVTKRPQGKKITILHLFLSLNFLLISYSYFGLVDYVSNLNTRVARSLEWLLPLCIIYFSLHTIIVIKFDR